MFRSICGRLLLLSLVLGFAGSALAQSQATTGVIQGTIEDASGAAVPGADVEARNVDTNLTRTLTSSSDGRFVFLQLTPGRYTVTVTLTGFATLVQEGVTLTVGQTLTLSPKLKVSSVAETVTVTGTATVDTSKSEVSSTLNETTISTTPVLGRKFEDLLTLTPGVAVSQGPDGDVINFAGQRGVYNNISLDGGDYNNGFFGEQVGGQRAAIDITLDAIQEFQVVAAGANAEFGRTAGGVVNVITKSGTNEVHGSVFHFQRLEALTSNTSDGKPLKDFRREQFGGTIGGPIQKDKAFFFLAAEHINSKLTRDNLSAPLGACPVSNPTIQSNEGLIAANAECQRLALLDFFRSSRNQEEGQPVKRTINNTAVLAKLSFQPNPKHNLAISYSFDYSKNENETFDVATYGNSANGTEGASKINVANLNLFSTLSPSLLNEFHFTYSRENRPRQATPSNVPADTAMGFVNTFRFGNPFFLQPTIDELFWRTQIKDNVSLVKGKHTIKLGGEWIHSLNDQVFRGFHSGLYKFDSVTGFLRYASPAGPGGFGPNVLSCADGTYITFPEPCPGGGPPVGGPVLLFLQSATREGPPSDAGGASTISNDEIALFAQDSWKVTPNLTLNYGLRWEVQLMADTVDPQRTAYAQFLDDPSFPSDGTIPDQWDMIQPRFGFNWDIGGKSKSVLRGSAGLFYARQNMLSQVSSVTTNGLQQFTVFRASFLVPFGVGMPTWPGLVAPPPPLAEGEFLPGTGVNVAARDYKNPRTFTANVGFERELAPDWSAYVDLTYAKSDNLTRFIDFNVSEPGVCCDLGPGTGNQVIYPVPGPFAPELGAVTAMNSLGESEYRGGTIGIRKRFSGGYQLEANYTLSKDEDDDSNERDPFQDFNFDFFDLGLDYGYSARDIRHRFNLFGYGELGPIRLNARVQARSAQPITPSPRVLNGVDRGRNSDRKDNEFFSFDWRAMWPITFGGKKQYQLIPIVEMFNTFNNDNLINPLATPGLFNFDGFLRQGVGDPRQMQLALKFTF